MFALFGLITITVYKLPFAVFFLLQVVILYKFYHGQKSYFYLALMFLIEAHPSSLFYGVGGEDATHTATFLRGTPIGALFFWMVFIFVAYLKVAKSKTPPFFLQNIITVIAVYLIFLIFAFGIGKLSMFMKGAIPLVLLFVIPRLLRNEEDYIKFFNLIFAFVFFNLVTQILYITTGHHLSTVLGGSQKRIDVTAIEEASNVVRPVAGIVIPYTALIGSAIVMNLRKNPFSRNYLFIIMSLSYFSLFITATRGWLVSGTLFFLAALFVNMRNPLALLPRLIIPLIILIAAFMFLPFLKKQTEMSMERYATILLLAEGDETAGGTSKRLDVRSPVIMKKFWESPIIGHGYGTYSMANDDGHVGNQNLLFQTGIIGYFLFVLLVFIYIGKLFQRWRSLRKSNPYRNVLLLFIAFIPAAFVIHTATRQWFGFTMYVMDAFVTFIVFHLANLVYMEAPRLEAKSSASKQIHMNI